MGEGAAVHELKQKEAQRRISREELLQPKIKEEDLPISELGGSVKIRSLSQERRRLIREGSKAGTPEYDEGYYELLLVVYSVVEPKMSMDDVEALKDQDASIIDQIIIGINMLNMFGTLDQLKNALSETQN